MSERAAAGHHPLALAARNVTSVERLAAADTDDGLVRAWTVTNADGANLVCSRLAAVDPPACPSGAPILDIADVDTAVAQLGPGWDDFSWYGVSWVRTAGGRVVEMWPLTYEQAP